MVAMTPFLEPEDRAQLKERFDAELTSRVNVRLFTRKPGANQGPMPECYSCDETGRLLVELAELSDNIEIEVIDIDEHPDVAASAAIEVTPTITVANDTVRFIGFPAGYEFVAFIETLCSVPATNYGLDGPSIERVKAIDKAVMIKVFSTPT